MENVLEKMKIDLRIRGFTNRELGSRFGVSHTTIQNYYSGNFDFLHFLQMLRLQYPDSIKMRRHVVEEALPNLSLMNQRTALEALDLFGEFDLLEKLIFKIESSDSNTRSSKLNKQLSSVYKLLPRRFQNDYNKKEFLDSVESLKKSYKLTSNDATLTNIIIEFALLYAYLDYGDFKMVSYYNDELTPLITNINKDTLSGSLLLRNKEMEATVLHHDNKLDKSREVCLDIINDLRNPYVYMKGVAYSILGETYILDSNNFENAKKYFEHAIECVDVPCNIKAVHRKEMFQTNLDFLRISQEKELELVAPKDISEQAHLFAKTGKGKLAVELLDYIEKNKGYLNSFEKLYKGIATGKKYYFRESYNSFLASGDNFYLQLPLQYL
ncbi:AimR family lysis-lysogeny pheromone receptor [Bacillus sp. Fil]|uniref:AimR family lysis-lysogeny pheromone receptor n=1 Tax=Bacillus sp. Fil TaxID=3459567 RepID=UPI00403B34E8